MPVIGFENNTIGTLRLWQCEAEKELDFDAFNAQNYAKALETKNKAEDITRVLYPNDSTLEGKQLRIKQQYVLSSASLQDILRSFRENHGCDYYRLPEFDAVQLNDTHPAMAIPELIRLLQLEGMDFESAFQIAARVFSYTNHTVMGEALEKWDLELLRSVVPEICDIIEKIDTRLKKEHPDSGLFLIKDHQAHMANLSVYVSTAVNGVAPDSLRDSQKRPVQGLVSLLPRALPEQDQRHYPPALAGSLQPRAVRTDRKQGRHRFPDTILTSSKDSRTGLMR